MYKYMDDVEVDIRAIKNLKLVHFYHILKEGKIVPAAMVHYNSDKMMNLCVLDKHYDEFIAQLFMVYENESDRDEIIMDEYSRAILDRAIFVETGFYDEYLKQLTMLDKPLYYHQSYMPYIVVPLIKYVIRELYGITGKKIEWNPVLSSWFGKGTLSATATEGEETFPFVLTAVEVGKYNARIGNFFTLKDYLEMQITFDYSGIKIRAISNGAGVDARIEYMINPDNSKVVCSSNVILKDRTVYSDQTQLEKSPVWTDTSKLDQLMGFDNQNTDYYKLPWGQYLVVENKVVSELQTDTNYVKIAFVTKSDERNNGFVISYNTIKNPSQGAEYTIFNFAADIFEEKIFGKDVQVYFDSLGFRSRGYYKAHLADRYFSANNGR